MLKTKLLSIYSVRKNIQCPFLLCFGVHTSTQYALSCKIQKFYIKADRKITKYNLGTPMLKAELLRIYSVKRNIQCPFLLCLAVYNPTQLALSCKMLTF